MVDGLVVVMAGSDICGSLFQLSKGCVGPQHSRGEES